LKQGLDLDSTKVYIYATVFVPHRNVGIRLRKPIREPGKIEKSEWMTRTDDPLLPYGLNETIQTALESCTEPGLEPARVISAGRERYQVQTRQGAAVMEVPGKFYFSAADGRDLPTVGDWTVVRRIDDQTTLLHSILPRFSLIHRKTAGKRTDYQLLAANVNKAFILSGLDQEINHSRVLRYMALAAEGGCAPVLLFSKKDQLSTEGVAQQLEQCQRLAGEVPFLLYSAEDSEDLAKIFSWITPGETICFLGPSGVGKSTLINRLVGRQMFATGEVRDKDAKGRHTTTFRQLVLLPNGGLVIDNPGLRELGFIDLAAGLEETFADLYELAQQCRFRDCTHQQEPGCALRQAVETKQVTAERFKSFVKLSLEQRQAQIDPLVLELKRKQKDKILGRAIKRYNENREK